MLNVDGPLSITVQGVQVIPGSHAIGLPGNGYGYRTTGEKTVKRDEDYTFTLTFVDGFKAGSNFKVVAQQILSQDLIDNGYTPEEIQLTGKDGTYTVARLDQESGDYMILPLLCKTTEGPQTHGTYIWGEFADLQAVEDRLMDGPYIHHFVEMEGDYRKEIEEFCKYIPNLKVDKTVH